MYEPNVAGPSNITVYDVMSVPQKNVPRAVVIYYFAWYVFLRDRR